MSQSRSLHVPSLLSSAYQSYSKYFFQFGGRERESSLIDALKLHYVSHVRVSSVLSICGERRREHYRGWSQSNQGWGCRERNGEISQLAKTYKSPKVDFLASVLPKWKIPNFLYLVLSLRGNAQFCWTRTNVSSFPNFHVLDSILICIHICAGDLKNMLLFPSQAVGWGWGRGVEEWS